MGRRMVSRGLGGLVFLLVAASCDDRGEPDPCEGVDCGPCGVCVAEGDRVDCFCAPGCVPDGLDCVPEAGDGDGDADEDAPVLCGGAAECDDGLFCNGEERCDPGSDEVDELGCAPGEPPDCDDGLEGTTDSCSEELDDCVHVCPDVDGDGHADRACVDEDGDPLGDDCDDLDPFRYPGNVEVCDPGMHDEDCDLETAGETDVDGDGFVSDGCCNFVEGETDEPLCGPDCDDDNGDVNPEATEVCDPAERDEDCDGLANEFLTVWCYPDADNDGYAAEGAVRGLECPVEGRGLVGGCPDFTTNREPADAATTDCDDTPPSGTGEPRGSVVFPGALERCDGIDDDCDGLLSAGDPGDPSIVDEDDTDGDGYVACEPESPGLLGHDCDDEDERAFPGQTEYFDWPARRGASGFDFNCNTIEEVEDTTMGWCTPTFSLTCELMPAGGGWAGTNPVVCGVRRYYVTGCPASLPCDPDSWTYVDIRPMCH